MARLIGRVVALALDHHRGVEVSRVWRTFTSGVPLRHDDGDGNTEPLAVIGQALGVVAGAGGDHPAPALLLGRGGRGG